MDFIEKIATELSSEDNVVKEGIVNSINKVAALDKFKELPEEVKGAAIAWGIKVAEERFTLEKNAFNLTAEDAKAIGGGLLAGTMLGAGLALGSKKSVLNRINREVTSEASNILNVGETLAQNTEKFKTINNAEFNKVFDRIQDPGKREVYKKMVIDVQEEIGRLRRELPADRALRETHINKIKNETKAKLNNRTHNLKHTEQADIINYLNSYIDRNLR